MCVYQLRQNRKQRTFKPKKKQYWYTPIKEWFELLKAKKKVYLALIPHVFDQATDYGVIYEYYMLWEKAETCGVEEFGAANPKTFLYASLFVIVLHRVISTVAIYKLTKSCKDVILQLFDLLMVKAVWYNYKMHKNEPTNPQRYLQILEATFESAPQIIISVGFILKKSTLDTTICDEASEPISAVIYISTIFSLWSLVSRVSTDDTVMYSQGIDDEERWRNLEFKYYKCPCMNWRWLWRVFLWRFLEITNRVFICVLLWVNLGGLALSIILGVEFLYCCIWSIVYKSIDHLAHLMYITNITDSDLIPIIFWWYRLISSLVYLILITKFASEDFEAAKVEDAETRFNITIRGEIGLFMLIYSWVSGFIWPYAALYAVRKSRNNTRDIRSLLNDGCLDEALELIEFGLPLTRDICTGNKNNKGTLLSCIKIFHWSVDALILIQKIVSVDPSLVDKEDGFYSVEMEAKTGGSLLHLAVAIAKSETTKNQTEIIKKVIHRSHADINSVDDDGNTVFHWYAAQGALDMYDMRNIQILFQYGLDANIKNNDNKTAYEILIARNGDEKPKIVNTINEKKFASILHS